MEYRPKLGLALGGGFLKGMAHIGVLKVLTREGITPDLVAGTSSGSIVAALYAMGWPVQKMERFAHTIQARDVYDLGGSFLNLVLMLLKIVLDFLHLPSKFCSPLGLMKGNKLEHLMKKLVELRAFSEMERPLAITAVDIRCATRVIFLSEKIRLEGHPDVVYLRDVPIAQAIRASCSVPGIFEPKRIGEYLLVDGGLRENVPAEILKRLGAEVVIAVDVGYQGEQCKEVDNLAELLSRTLEIVAGEGTGRELEQYAEVIIRPVIEGVQVWDFDKAGYCIQQGEIAAREALSAIWQVLGH